MKELDITVQHEAGLHLRPAAMFVQTAASFNAAVQVRNNERDTGFKNAKSALEVMMLGVSQGHSITIRADGEDEDEAVEALAQLIESNFQMAPPAGEGSKG